MKLFTDILKIYMSYVNRTSTVLVVTMFCLHLHQFLTGTSLVLHIPSLWPGNFKSNKGRVIHQYEHHY